MTLHDVKQRTTDWYALRLGKVTGSCASAIVAERKRGTGELAVRTNLRRRLVCERLTGLSAENEFQSDDMARGLAVEADAFAAYEIQTGLLVSRIGFVSHDTLAAGCSPDGYVGNFEGVIELKAPKSTTHLEYLQAGVLPEEYRGQVIHALWLTGAAWCDFCSFDPRFPAALELFRVRVERKAEEMDAYALAVSLFLSDVDREVEALRARVEVAA